MTIGVHLIEYVELGMYWRHQDILKELVLPKNIIKEM